MKVMVNLLTNPNIGRAAIRSETASQIAAEYWAKRAMWLLVIVTSLWDIVVTFDKHFELSGRLLSGRLL
jgi:hypothetical protein